MIYTIMDGRAHTDIDAATVYEIVEKSSDEKALAYAAKEWKGYEWVLVKWDETKSADKRLVGTMDNPRIVYPEVVAK